MAVGDLLGSGTISGPALEESHGQEAQRAQQESNQYALPGNKGSLLEMTNNGKTAVRISVDSIENIESKNGGNGGKEGKVQVEERMFLEDGDTVTLRGWCGGGGGGDGGDDDDGEEELVGFGECVGTIMPAVALDL